MANIGELRTKISLDSAEFQRSMASVNRELRGLKYEQRAVTSTGTGFARGLTEMRAKADVLNRTLDLQKQQVAELKRRYEESRKETGEHSRQTEQAYVAYQKAQAEMNKTEHALRNLTAEIKRQENPWTKLGERMGTFGTKLQDVGRGMSDFGKTYSMYVTAPIVAGGTAVFKAAMDYEAAFAGVRKTVHATEAEFAKLSDGIRAMTREIPASATEIAGVAEAAGQLGIANEHILSFTRTMIDMGEATNLSAEQAATELARFANIVGMSQGEFDRLGSTIVELGNNLATTEREIVEMGMRLAGAGAQIGLTEAQIMSFAAALSSVGIEAEAGGSAFSRVMINISNAVQSGGEELGQFAKVAGMSSKEFRKAFEDDAAGAIIAFIAGLSKMSEEGKNVFKVLDDLGLSEIRVRDALLRAAGASDVFTNSIEMGSRAWEENVALTEEAEQRYQTTESQLRIMWNRIKDVAISLGNSLAPAVMDAIDAAEPLIQQIESGAKAFTDLDESQQRTILRMIALAAAVGPVTFGLGQVTSGVGGLLKVGGDLAQMLGRAGAAGGTGLLGRLALMGPGAATPVGLAIAGVGLLGVGIYALTRDKEKLHEVSTETADKFRKEAETLEGLVDRYEELRSKTSLSNDEFGRMIDIQKELEVTQNPARIAELQAEYEALAKKSGLSNKELDEMIGLNDKIVKQSPAVTQAYTEQGNQIVENTDAVREYVAELKQMALEELRWELAEALENEKRIREENKEIARELARVEKELNQLVEYRKMPLDEVDARLEEINQKMNSGMLTQEEYLKLEREQALLLQVQNGFVTEAYENLKKQRDELLKKQETNQEELAKLEEIKVAMADLLLAEVDLNWEQGKGLKQLDEKIAKLKKERDELVKNTSSEEKKTQEYRNQLKLLDDEIRKHENIREQIKQETGYQAQNNHQLDLSNQKMNLKNRQLEKAIGNVGKVGAEQSKTNKKFDEGTKKAGAMTREAGKDVTKKVNITDKGGVSALNKRASSPVSKKVSLIASWSNLGSAFSTLTSGITSALRRIRIPGFATGTNYAPSGLAWLGEEGPELVKYRDKWALADFGLYNLRGGEQVFTHEQSMKILRALNNIPGYATGTNMGSETNRIVNQLNDRDRTIINNENNIVINATIRDDSDIYKLTTKLDEKLSELGNRRQAAWGGA